MEKGMKWIPLSLFMLESFLKWFVMSRPGCCKIELLVSKEIQLALSFDGIHILSYHHHISLSWLVVRVRLGCIGR